MRIHAEMILSFVQNRTCNRFKENLLFPLLVIVRHDCYRDGGVIMQRLKGRKTFRDIGIHIIP